MITRPQSEAWSQDHTAMNTVFTLRISPPFPKNPEAVAAACFTEIDDLEGLLSRYLPDSDITRINLLSEGESVYIDGRTHEVLLASLTMNQRTSGLFDISLGSLSPPVETNGPDALDGCLEIDPIRPLVRCIRTGRSLDLGGIGKGYALDRAAKLLQDLDVTSALLSAGASTHLAVGPSPWEISLTACDANQPLTLLGKAVSSSGLLFQDNHIVTSHGAPSQYNHHRCWVVAGNGTQADALSTAVMLMDNEKISELLAREEGSMEIYSETLDGGIIRHSPPAAI
jgi:thiamine biosynthesis lipoprotein